MGEFEQIPEIAERIKRSKMELQDNGNYWTPEWDSQSCCDQDFVNNFKKGWQHQQAIINEHTEVIKLQDTDLRKYEKQIESLKEQLNNMEACYIEKKKECDDAVYLKEEHRKRRCQLAKELTQKSLRLTDAEFEYKRIKELQAKDCLQIMRLTARNEKLSDELKALRGANA